MRWRRGVRPLSPDYIPIEELKAANDPRYHAVIDGEWNSATRRRRVPRSRRADDRAMIDDHPGQRIAVVCHGGVINGYLCHVSGCSESAGLLLSQLHQHQPHRRGAVADAIRRDHQRDLPPARHGTADGSVPGDSDEHRTSDDLAISAFLDASPSPWHVVSTAAIGWLPPASTVDARDAVERRAGRGFVVRGAALVAWRLAGGRPMPHSPFRLVGAHTDSPGLRVKPRPDTGGVGWKQLGVEVYGGP